MEFENPRKKRPDDSKARGPHTITVYDDDGELLEGPRYVN